VSVQYEKEVAVIALLIALPLLFVPIGGYYQWLLGYTYLLVLQGYVAWFLFYRVGQSFFGYAALLGMGAYVTGVAVHTYHWPMLAGMFVAVLATAAVSVAMFLATCRQRGFYMGLTSFLIVVLFQSVATASPILGKNGGIVVESAWRGIMEFGSFCVLISTAMVACIGVIFWIMRTETGKVFTLICENEELAKAVGIHTTEYKLMAYLVGGIIAGFGGALFINYIGIISPTDVSMEATMEIFFLPLIGGPATLYGPLLGGLIVIWLAETFRIVEYYLPIVIGMSYILVIGFAPEGVGHYIEICVKYVLRRQAKQRVTGSGHK
jgi:branched-chain amino acid transport system permease protein